MKRFLFLIIFVSVMVGLVGYSKWRSEPNRVSGFVEADEIRLGSRVGGRVATVNVDEGDQVTAGQILIELEPYDLLEREKEAEASLAASEAEYQRFTEGFREEEIAQAKAKFEQLQAQFDLLKAGPRKQEIESARARLTQAEAEKKLAELNYARQAKLAESDAASEQELDAAREALDAATANVTVRDQELNLLESGTREEELREAAARVEEARQSWQLMVNGYRTEDIQRAKATRDAAKAKLAAIGQQKSELEIRSPITGTVEALDLQPGDIVAPSAPVLSMLDRNKLWVRAYIPENRIALQTGDRLQLTVDGYPDQEFFGTVTYIARQAEFTPSNVQTPEERSKQVFRVKVEIDDAKNLLRPGMIADVWLDKIGDAK